MFKFKFNFKFRKNEHNESPSAEAYEPQSTPSVRKRRLQPQKHGLSLVLAKFNDVLRTDAERTVSILSFGIGFLFSVVIGLIAVRTYGNNIFLNAKIDAATEILMPYQAEESVDRSIASDHSDDSL